MSCWYLSLSIIRLKFLFNNSISLSALTSGTLVSNLPSPILADAVIKLFIEIKNLDENLIAIVIERNNKRVTKDIYIKAKEILIPRLWFSTV